VTALTVWSREGCTLCDELLEELAPWAAARGLAVDVRDVDDDATAKRRYGLRVPVVTLDGAPVCHGRLDLRELERLLAGRP
jgi:predicted thioredoxin/glutaredoxin